MSSALDWQSRGMPDAAGLFEQLRALSDGSPGITRAAYSPTESAALDLIAAVAAQHGLKVARDAAANLLVCLPGQETSEPFIVVGSHLDTVPHGGNYDGAAGVIAGLMCLIRMRMEERTPAPAVKLLALRAEESPWFDTACLGSRALFGELAGELGRTHRSTGLPLQEHLRAVGADVESIARGRTLLPPKRVAGYYELHIEQGPVLVERDVPVAVVTGIRGILRFPAIRCLGEEGHSGAVPRELRRDAVAAVVDLLYRIEQHWRDLLDQKADLVITSGVLSTPSESHSPSRIAGEATFSLDIRSIDHTTLAQVRSFVQRNMETIERERNVRFDVGTRYLTPPESMDPSMRTCLARTAARFNIPFIEMASGSGHDAMVFARHGIPSAMIFVRNQNGSHNPNEAMAIPDFLDASELLYRVLTERVRSGVRD